MKSEMKSLMELTWHELAGYFTTNEATVLMECEHVNQTPLFKITMNDKHALSCEAHDVNFKDLFEKVRDLTYAQTYILKWHLNSAMKNNNTRYIINFLSQ